MTSIFRVPVYGVSAISCGREKAKTSVSAMLFELVSKTSKSAVFAEIETPQCLLQLLGTTKVHSFNNFSIIGKKKQVFAINNREFSKNSAIYFCKFLDTLSNCINIKNS